MRLSIKIIVLVIVGSFALGVFISGYGDEKEVQIVTRTVTVDNTDNAPVSPEPVEQVAPHSPVPVSDVNNLYDQTDYDSGYDSGYLSGFSDGSATNNDSGFQNGYLNGYDQGFQAGYEEGSLRVSHI